MTFFILGLCDCLQRHDCTNMKKKAIVYSKNKYHSKCVHVFNKMLPCSAQFFYNYLSETIAHKTTMVFKL